MARGGVRIRLKYEGLDQMIVRLQGDRLYGPAWRKFMLELRDLVDLRLAGRVPLGESHALFDSLRSSVDPANVPLWVRFSADAAAPDGFRYGMALQASKTRPFRYRAGPRAGKRTRGWFTGSLSGARKRINALLNETAAAIERGWSGGA